MANDLIEAYLDHLKMRERSHNTVRDRGEILYRLDHDLPFGLDLASAEELACWLYRDGWSAQTKATYFGAVRGFFVWANDPKDPILDFDPTDLLVRPTVPDGVPRPITDGQLEQILSSAQDPYVLWSELAAYQGMRCCEIAALDREHVTETFTLVYGKGRKERYVPTDPAVWRAVQHFPAGPIATDRAGRRATPTQISDRSKYHFRHVCRVDATLHRLRHWYATTALALCGDLRKVQELLGHASPDTTAVYTKVTPEQLRDAVRGMPRFGAAAGAGATSASAAR